MELQKKTYITTMPNHIGAFLQASRCFAQLGVNITRVSYNKAVDSHMLFIDAEGTPEQLQQADALLRGIGYLPQTEAAPQIVLIAFHLRDVPGAVTEILTLIEQFGFNISYLSSQADGSGYQTFKMGLFVEDRERIEAFLHQAQELCPAQLVDYNPSERVFDNSIFYRSFISGLAEMMQISGPARQELLVNANLAMQTLDERGLSPFRTFDSIFCFTRLLAACRGAAFQPRVTRHAVTEQTSITLIEPACGSNTAIVQSGGKVLFIDCGYACYREEMQALFRQLLPDYDTMEKTILITHADVDHCGLLPLFDRILASRKSAACLENEFYGRDGFREQNPLHKPYIRMCKLLTSYAPPQPERLAVPWDVSAEPGAPLSRIGDFSFGELRFAVYEGAGGHLPGEIVLIDRAHRLAFTGDVFVNLKDMTREQQQYNRYAPILMTSVDTDPALCAAERKAIFSLLGEGRWLVFGAHGAAKALE